MLPCPHQTFLDCRFGRLEALRDFPNAVLLKIIQNNAGPLILLQPHDAFIQFRILSVPTYVFRFPAFFPHPWVSLFGIANADESAVIVEDLHSVISGHRWSP